MHHAQRTTRREQTASLESGDDAHDDTIVPDWESSWCVKQHEVKLTFSPQLSAGMLMLTRASWAELVGGDDAILGAAVGTVPLKNGTESDVML